MSLLAPFYILGALAVAAPVVLHLIRRTPKGEVPFSSLMFLAPTPPRLTRRSRLDNLLLLLLRAGALILLALAFARPFLREAASLDFGDVERRRDLVLIDASASLRRGDLWAKAKEKALAAIADARPADQLAVYAFDATTRPLLTFAESTTLDPAKRLAIARGRLAELEPTWASTDLGRGLVDAVAEIEAVADASEKAGRMPRRIILVGDLAQGSKLDALGDFEWPSDVELDPRSVTDPAPNAGLHPVNESTEATAAESAREVRVRVSNDPGSRREAFQIAWVDAKGNEVGPPVDAYVPPGETRVVKVPRAGPASSTLRLKGDAHGFDNALYLAGEARAEATVLYVGTDAPDDAEGLLYYLGRVFEDTPRRSVKVVARKPGDPIAVDSPRSTPLVVLAGEVSGENSAALRKYAEAGGTVLFVIGAPGPSATLAALAEAPALDPVEAPSGRDAMLAEIAFDHPLFAPLAGPQFNDFTKIRFWKHRKIDPVALGEARVLARFEGGDPAFVDKPIGKGRLVVMASGWNPVDSQLARSSKFVPLMAALLEGRAPPPVELASLTVGDRVPWRGTEMIAVRKPDGSTFIPGTSTAAYDDTNLPGVYAITMAYGGPRTFAVNLDPLESKTAPLGVETLEKLGIRLSTGPAKEALDREHLRQLQNAELEGRQKLWRGLILAAIGVLILETWLAGRLKRPSPSTEALAT